ncbi:unnamed protein product [Clonostachys rosea]|uniref:FAD dependent oxidoreductase domain-containing protein n=1 Tax=Bionectria ochroleuca TaxID=29856 RepID=A0ABY6TXC6_BIOOC|nr:unnamed protein product [Clonostachys rosea]
MATSLPVEGSTLSHWHRTTRSFPYLNTHRFASVPASSEYLIIGSGITGALSAWELVNSGVSGSDILILEAREAVSGASGRNAGHVRPDAFRGFERLRAIHGSEQAVKILESEKIVLRNVRNFVETNEIDCDFVYTTTLEVCMNETHAASMAEAFSRYRQAGGDVSHVRFYQGEEAKAKSGVSAAICAYEWPAGSNHPGKLTQWILSDIIAKGARLWTHCPAIKVSKCQRPGGKRWDVQTPRGVTNANTVVHCTNAYAAYLLPELSGLITPRRAQGHSYIPPASLSGENMLKSTMSLRYGPSHYFSVNQLKDGTVILGGQATRTDADRNEEYMKDRASFDDSKHNPEQKMNSVTEFAKLAARGPSSQPRPGEGLSHVWTGIVGETPDAVPFIGPIEGLEGQWICAGFNGHGMGRIFHDAPALVQLMRGIAWEETGLPECFRFSKKRVEQLSKKKWSKV